MHDIRYLAKNFSEASERLARRGFELPPDVQILDHQRRTLAQHISQQRAAAKQEAALIGRLRSAGELGGIALQERTDTARAQREAIQIAECQQREVSATLQQLLLSIPNFPADRVPAGIGFGWLSYLDKFDLWKLMLSEDAAYITSGATSLRTEIVR